MLDAVGHIYNTLFDVIETIAGTDFKTFDRGFWYKGEDCSQRIDLFPYAFLDQPETTPVVGVSNPTGYRYLTVIRIGGDDLCRRRRFIRSLF